MKRAIVSIVILIAALAFGYSEGLARSVGRAQVHTGGPCPLVLPQGPIAVAPGQPEVEPGSTRGIINALCEVTLNLVNCGFFPTSVMLTCDTNGDGVAELIVPLKNVTAVNANLVRATLPRFSDQLPGTAFPLTCCGGTVSLVLTRRLRAADDNVFGDVVQTVTCEIDIGLRAPVVVSVSPSEGDCSVAQNLVIPGSCFVGADGKPVITRVFAVERDNPENVIEATRFVVLNPNLIDALFDFGASSAGKTFLVFVTGPNGTSRNLTSLPAGAPEGCPTGNEQGIQVTFTCKSQSAGGGSPTPQPPAVAITGCKLNRSATGSFTLTLDGRFAEGSQITLNGVASRKTKLKRLDAPSNVFTRAVLKGGVCGVLPGVIIVTSPDGTPSAPFQCLERCPTS